MKRMRKRTRKMTRTMNRVVTQRRGPTANSPAALVWGPRSWLEVMQSNPAAPLQGTTLQAAVSTGLPLLGF